MEIAIYLRKKYNKISELFDLTRQMAEALQRNDLVSFEVLLTMRTDVILDIEQITYTIQDILQTTEPEFAKKINLFLQHKTTSFENLSVAEQKICTIVSESANLTQRLISLDKIVNKKISGNDSFYQN